MWFYQVGMKVEVDGQVGVIETQPKPYWYGVRLEESGELIEVPEGAIKEIPKKKAAPRKKAAPEDEAPEDILTEAEPAEPSAIDE